MMKSAPYNKNIYQFYLLCVISCVLLNGMFLLGLSGEKEYISDSYLVNPVCIMLVLGIFLDFLHQHKSATQIALIAIIINIPLVLLAENTNKNFYGLVFIINALLYIICIADYCYLLDYSEKKFRNYFKNLLLMTIFAVFYIGIISMLFLFFIGIQSV